MSRSKRYTPIFGIASGNCKEWRKDQNQKYRAYCKNLIRHGKYELLPKYKGKFGNEWDSPRDGKQYLGNWYYGVCGNYVWFSFNGQLFRNCMADDHWRCSEALKKLMRK